LAFTEYNLAITKNLKFIATKLADLEADSRADLCKFTKDIGNTFLNSYEYYSKMMNNQRIENMRLQSEVNILISEKNTLRNQVKNLTYSCEKMEKYLGVTQLSND